jgi:hypothetical protein
MEGGLNFFEKIVTGLGVLIGHAIGAAGEKVGTALPAGRPMDKIATARRMSRDQAEAYNLYNKLLKYSDQAEDMVTHVCWGAVISALDPAPDDLTNPLVIAANQLCRDILRYEQYFPLPEIDFSREHSLGEMWSFTKLIRRCLALYESKTQQEKIRNLLEMFLLNLLHDLEGRQWLDERLIRVDANEARFATTLESLHANVAGAIDTVVTVLGQGCTQDGEPFPRLYDKMEKNILLASGIDPDRRGNKKPELPGEVKGLWSLSKRT